jgi:hypothetical protein
VLAKPFLIAAGVGHPPGQVIGVAIRETRREKGESASMARQALSRCCIELRGSRKPESMNTRMESFRNTALLAGLAVSIAVLSLGLIFVVADGSRNAQSPKRSGVLPGGEVSSGNAAKPNNCPICGTVESIRVLEVRVETGEAGTDGIDSGRPAGVAAGRSGNDNSSMTLLEVAGSLFSGSSDGTRKRNVYRVTVRMDDGSYRTLSLSSPPTFAVGNKVRVIEGKLVRA